MHKSQRHRCAANARWARRPAPDDPPAPMPSDQRRPIDIDLSSYGGRRLRIEPRAGYIACRLIDADSGAVLRAAALKTLLRDLADSLPRTLSSRHEMR